MLLLSLDYASVVPSSLPLSFFLAASGREERKEAVAVSVVSGRR